MSCWTAPFVFEEDLWSTASLWEIGRSSTLWRCSFRFALLGHKAKKPVHLATSLPKTLNWGTHRYTTISNISPICRFLQRALTLPTRHPARINLQPCQHGDIGRKDLTLVSKAVPSRLALKNDHRFERFPSFLCTKQCNQCSPGHRFWLSYWATWPVLVVAEQGKNSCSNRIMLNNTWNLNKISLRTRYMIFHALTIWWSIFPRSVLVVGAW